MPIGIQINYSTELSIHHIPNQIYELLDTKQCQITVFYDLSKASDTIPHDILLQKEYEHGKQYVYYQNFIL